MLDPRMTSLGVQVFGDLYQCEHAALDDLPRVQAVMLEAARRCGATVVADFAHRFSPHGCSGVVVIAESHLAIHTWPEEGYAAVDLFTCGQTLRPEPGFAYLIEALGSRYHTLTTTRRGSRRRARAPDGERAAKVITILDGSPVGARAETAALVGELRGHLEGAARVRVVHLGDDAAGPGGLEPILRASDGFVLAASLGDGWGGPLPAFLAAAGRAGNALTWLGKPAAVAVATHGEAGEGRALVARLQGALSTMGCVIPPMSGVVCARADRAVPGDHGRLEELEVVADNLLEAVRGGAAWRTWRIAPAAGAAADVDPPVDGAPGRPLHQRA